MPILAGPEPTSTPAANDVARALDTPPENTDPEPTPTNPIDDAETELHPLEVGTPAQIQAMLEQPTGLHQVDDGNPDGSTVLVATLPITPEGVVPSRAEPTALIEERQTTVLTSMTGTDTGSVAQ